MSPLCLPRAGEAGGGQGICLCPQISEHLAGDTYTSVSFRAKAGVPGRFLWCLPLPLPCELVFFLGKEGDSWKMHPHDVLPRLGR